MAPQVDEVDGSRDDGVFVQLSPQMRWLLCLLAPIRFMGYISFFLYLVHGEVLSMFSAWLFLRLFREGEEGGWAG